MIFLCTNCLACSTRCPRGIPVADLMMKLRNLSIANHLSSTENEAASREFVRNVLKRGRVYEPELMIRLAMKTSPSSLLNLRDIAIALLRKGKLNLPSKSQTDLRELRRKFKEGE